MKDQPISPQLLDLLFDKRESELTEAETNALVAHFGSLDTFREFSSLQQQTRSHFDADPEPPADAFAAILDRVDPPKAVPTVTPESKKKKVWAFPIPLYQAAAVALLLMSVAWILGSQRGKDSVEPEIRIAEADTVIREVMVWDTVFVPAASQEVVPQLEKKRPQPKVVPAPKQKQEVRIASSENEEENLTPLGGWNPNQALENLRQDEGSARSGSEGSLRLVPDEPLWSIPLDLP